ncbi:hypothetical protein CQW23_16151 [Capsicum baccatum]|uniref:Knottins-like domain-containing protein n=1 Tax=Capsicum baccatum TaxID=33114 RepID=A0A2G2WA64_CAPBA|nr:hypothetical protein CQW23_16151 [Capsicum baccatum]
MHVSEHAKTGHEDSLGGPLKRARMHDTHCPKSCFADTGVQGKEICCKELTKPVKCSSDPLCQKLCMEKEKYEDGHCFTILSKCLCMKRCNAKTLATELLD